MEAFAGVVLLKKRFELILPVAVFADIEAMFLFGMIDHLHAGFAAICIFAIVLFLYSLYRSIKAKTWKDDLDRFVSVGFICFLVFYVFYSFCIKGLVPYHNDELSFWAVSIKKMWALDVFYCNPVAEQTAYSHYTPGMQLFEYISMAMQEEWDDWKMYVAYWTYILAIGAFFFQRFERKLKSVVPAVACAMLYFLAGGFFYTALYDNLMVDFPLGATFAFGMVLACMPDEKAGLAGIGKCIYIALIANTLILIKAAGMLFAVLLIVAYGFSSKWRGLLPKQFIIKIIIMILPFTSSWMWSLKYNSYQEEFFTSTGKYDIVQFIKILLGKEDYGYRTKIKDSFITYLLHTKVQFGKITLTNITLFVLFVLFLGLLYFYYKRRYVKVNKSVLFVSIGGALAYWLGLMGTYMYILSENDGKSLASIQRFLNIYHTMLGFLVIFFVILGIGNEAKAWFCWVVVILLLSFADYSVLEKLVQREYQAQSRNVMGSLYALSQQLDVQGRIEEPGERGTVLLVHNGAAYPHVPINGFTYLVFPYYRVPWECMYSDEKAFDNDHYTQILTKNEFYKHVKDVGVEYIAIDLLDDNFVALYQDLFDHALENGQVYHVLAAGKYELLQ